MSFLYKKSHNTPEIEVLGHVHLLEDIHEPLLLCWLVYSVVRADGDHLGVLAVVHVVATEKRDNRPL